MKLFLDVDGAVNAPDLPWKETVEEKTVDFVFMNNGRRFVREETIRWDSEVLTAFGDFINRNNIEVFWLTGWRGQAPKVWDSILNINSAGWVQWVWSGKMDDESGKLDALLQMVDSDEEFIWVDDIANVGVTFEGQNRSLLVTPVEPHCLTLDDVSDMIDFIK